MSGRTGNAFDWDDLKYFLAISRVGTLRGAAQSIGVNHTTLTRRLGLLEDRVAGRLFDRSTQGFVLTQLGLDLLPHAERVEDEIAAMSRTLVGRDAEPHGTIVITMPNALALTSIMDDMARFSEKYPSIDLNIQFSNDVANLARREADVSLRVANLVDDDVVGRKLVPCSQAAYCTQDYAAKMTDNEGEGLHFIGWNEPEGDTTASWLRNSCYPKATLKHRVSDLIPHVTLAASGMGLAYLACALGDRHPDLVRAPFQRPLPYRDLWLLLHRDLRKTARIRLFVDDLAAEIKARRAEFWPPDTQSP